MQPYSYSISLRVFHPTADPGEISRRLLLEPTWSWRAGAPRTTPVGTPLEGVYDQSYWCVDLVRKSEALTLSLEDCLADQTQRLEPHHEFFRSVWSEGGRVEYYVGVHGPASYGFVFAPELLGAMAGAGISLGLESFPVPQRA